MRRLFMMVVTLTIIVSVAIAVSSTRGQDAEGAKGCIWTQKQNDVAIFDVAAGRIMKIANGYRVFYSSPQQWENKHNQFTLMRHYVLNRSQRIYMQNPDKEYKFLNEIRDLRDFQWSPDNRWLAYIWSNQENAHFLSLFDTASDAQKTISITAQDFPRIGMLLWASNSAFFRWQTRRSTVFTI